MAEDAHEKCRMAASPRWGWRLAYILTPTAAIVGMLAVLQGVGSSNAAAWVTLLVGVPACSVALLTVLLIWRSHDFNFLIWGAPLAFTLLHGALAGALEVGIVRLSMCDGGMMLVLAVLVTSAVLLLGLITGLVRAIAVFCSKGAARVHVSRNNGGS